jgi:hypothetical protein
MRLRKDIRRQRQREDGRYVWGFGARLGYWPCLRAPFIRFDVATWIIEVWYGLPSYVCTTSLTKETT